MGRRKSDPEIRKMEFVRAAEELFREKGLDKTSIKDIANKVGVTHAAFFYYYKSKDEIFKDVVAYHLGQYEQAVKDLVADKNLSAVKKLQIILDMSLGSGRNDNKFVKHMHAEGNSAIHEQYVRRSQEIFIPMITRIVEQGVEEGTFDVPYPREAVEYMIHVFDSLDEMFYQPLSNDEYYRKMRTLELIMTRALGLKEGSLSCNIKRG